AGKMSRQAHLWDRRVPMRGTNRRILWCAGAALSLARFGAPNSAAATVSWLPNADGFWHVAANWSSNPLLPGPTDDVVIDVGGAAVRTITHSQGSTTVLSLTSQ